MPAAFVITAQGIRRDGRAGRDGRELDIQLERGDDAADDEVSLGGTRVIARASCALGAPDAWRPNEGSLRVKVDGAPRSRDDDGEGDPTLIRELGGFGEDWQSRRRRVGRGSAVRRGRRAAGRWR